MGEKIDLLGVSMRNEVVAFLTEFARFVIEIAPETQLNLLHINTASPSLAALKSAMRDRLKTVATNSKVIDINGVAQYRTAEWEKLMINLDNEYMEELLEDLQKTINILTSN
jgi:hypothetical protein